MSTPDRFFSDLQNHPSHRLVGFVFAGLLGFIVWRDVVGGEITWAGFFATIKRDERPLAFWATVITRAALGLLFLLGALGVVNP